MRKGRFARTVALLLTVTTAALFLPACYGKFQMTREVYKFNSDIENQYLRSAATWLLLIIPVYEVSALLDFVVFNLIEFWTGQNPVSSGSVTKEFAAGPDRAVMTLAREGEITVATIVRYRNGAYLDTLRIRDDGRGAVAAEADGAVRGAARASLLSDGSVRVAGTSGAWAGETTYGTAAVAVCRARVSRIAAAPGPPAVPVGTAAAKAGRSTSSPRG